MDETRTPPPRRSLGITRDEGLFLLGLFLLSFYIRAIYAHSFEYEPISDALGYHTAAVSFVSNFPSMRTPGPREAYYPPGYPVMLAAVYMIAGTKPAAAQLANSFVMAVAVLLTYVLARQLTGSKAVAVIASLLTALLNDLVILPSFLLTEVLFIPLSISVVIAAEAHRRAASGWHWLVVSGALLGLAILTRTQVVFAVPTLAIAVFASEKKRSESFKRGLLAACLYVSLVVALLLPWAVRNYFVIGQFQPFSSHGGVTLYRLNFYDPPHTEVRKQMYASGMWTEVWEDNQFKKLFWERVTADPVKFARFRWERGTGAVRDFLFSTQPLFPYNEDRQNPWVPLLQKRTISNLVSWEWLMPLGIAGMILSIIQWRRFYFIHALIWPQILFYVSLMVFWTRFRATFLPFLVLFLAHLVVSLSKWSSVQATRMTKALGSRREAGSEEGALTP